MLKAWLYDHHYHPYPTEEEKMDLAQRFALTHSQISNWFINARRRILAPMKEKAKVCRSRRANVFVSRSPLLVLTKTTATCLGSRRIRCCNAHRVRRGGRSVQQQGACFHARPWHLLNVLTRVRGHVRRARLLSSMTRFVGVCETSHASALP